MLPFAAPCGKGLPHPDSLANAAICWVGRAYADAAMNASANSIVKEVEEKKKKGQGKGRVRERKKQEEGVMYVNMRLAC